LRGAVFLPNINWRQKQGFNTGKPVLKACFCKNEKRTTKKDL
jgi:hypothetical protein